MNRITIAAAAAAVLIPFAASAEKPLHAEYLASVSTYKPI